MLSPCYVAHRTGVSCQLVAYAYIISLLCLSVTFDEPKGRLRCLLFFLFCQDNGWAALQVHERSVLDNSCAMPLRWTCTNQRIRARVHAGGAGALWSLSHDAWQRGFVWRLQSIHAMHARCPGMHACCPGAMLSFLVPPCHELSGLACCICQATASSGLSGLVCCGGVSHCRAGGLWWFTRPGGAHTCGMYGETHGCACTCMRMHMPAMCQSGVAAGSRSGILQLGVEHHAWCTWR